MGESADGMSNDQWLDRTRKDGGYWERAKKDMKINTNRAIQDLNGNTRFIGDDDLDEDAQVTPYGTRVYSKGKLLSDRIEGYNIIASGFRNRVTVTVTDVQMGFADVRAYDHVTGGNDFSTLYRVPTYMVTVSGSLEIDGKWEAVNYNFEAIRFGVETGSPARVVGLSSDQTHQIFWDHMSDRMEGFRITGGWFIHTGPPNDVNGGGFVQGWGALGCIEICGTGEWDIFKKAVIKISGVSAAKDDETTLSNINNAFIRFQYAPRPPLTIVR